MITPLTENMRLVYSHQLKTISDKTQMYADTIPEVSKIYPENISKICSQLIEDLEEIKKTSDAIGKMDRMIAILEKNL